MAKQKKPDTITEINPAERYNRQTLIPGWNQDALKNASITIIGSDWLATYAVMTAAALGIGNIKLVDDTNTKNRRFLNAILDNSTPDVEELSDLLSAINPLVKIQPYVASLANSGSKYFLEDSDIVLELTNNPRSKAIAIEYSAESGKKAIFASTMMNYGKLMVSKSEKDLDNPHYLMANFSATQQDPILSLTLASLAVEEARKFLMKEESLASTIYYNGLRPERFYPATTESEFKELSKDRLGRLRSALIVGAGALGTGIAVTIPFQNFGRVYVIDPDNVEETNLNRQVLYYDSVGEPKATSLSKKIMAMGVNAKGIVERFPTDKFDLSDVDVIFDCVDNFKTRLDISNYAAAHKIPLISGGTDYQSGQVAVYLPGETSCISHQLDLQKIVKDAAEREAQSCIYTPNPSVVTSNMIVSGLMAMEARAMYGAILPIKGTLRYGSNLEKRVGFNPLTELCDCYAAKDTSSEKVVSEKVSK